MKMLFTLMTLTCLSGGALMAQQNSEVIISTFEDGDNGLQDNTPWCNGDFFVVGASIMQNPLTNGLNTSEKCFGTVMKENSDWWGAWTFLDLKNPVTITEETKYLKMMVYRSANRGGLSIGWNTNTDAWLKSVAPRQEGVWEDVVFDLTDKIGTELKTMVLLHHNWDGQKGPQATYLYDNVILSSNSLPRGVTLMDGTGFEVNFEQEAQTNKWISKTEVFSPELNSVEIVANPTPEDALNKTAQVFKFEKGVCDWWHGGPKFVLNGLLELNEEKDLQYFHVAVNVPATAFDADGICTVQLCAWDHLGKETNKSFLLFDGSENMWQDLVFDLTEELNYTEAFSVRFDVRKDAADEWIKSPAGTFYLDAMTLDGNEAERDAILSSISNNKISGAKIFNTKAGINVCVDANSTVEVIAASGMVFKKAQLKSRDTAVITNLHPGVYLVRLTDEKGISKVQKVIIK